MSDTSNEVVKFCHSMTALMEAHRKEIDRHRNEIATLNQRLDVVLQMVLRLGNDTTSTHAKPCEN